jgi:hypothetical protein
MCMRCERDEQLYGIFSSGTNGPTRGTVNGEPAMMDDDALRHPEQRLS